MGYRDGGIGTAGTVAGSEELSDGSRKPEGLLGPMDGDKIVLGGLGIVETGDAEASSVRSSGCVAEAAAAASCRRRR